MPEVIVRDEAGRKFRVKYSGDTPPSMEDLLPHLQSMQKQIVSRDMQTGLTNAYEAPRQSRYAEASNANLGGLPSDYFSKLLAPPTNNLGPASQLPQTPRYTGGDPSNGMSFEPAPRRSAFENALIDLDVKRQLGNRDLVSKLTGEQNRPNAATNAGEFGTNFLESAARLPGVLASLPLSLLNQAEDFASRRNAVNALEDKGAQPQADALAKQAGKQAIGSLSGLILPFANELTELGYEGPDAALKALKNRALTDPASFLFDVLGGAHLAKSVKNAPGAVRGMRADYYDAQNAKTTARARAAQDAYDASQDKLPLGIESVPDGYKPRNAARPPAPTPPNDRGFSITGNQPVHPADGWRVTHYGQNDPRIETTPDTNSNQLRKGFNENGLDNDSFGSSPDVSAILRAKGIKPQDIVEFVLSDGRRVFKRWDDQTASGLTNRIDFFTDKGRNPLEGAKIVGFTKSGRGTKLALGSSTESKIPQSASTSLPSAPTPEVTPEVTPEAKADQMLAALDKQLGINAPQDLPGFTNQSLPEPSKESAIKAPEFTPEVANPNLTSETQSQTQASTAKGTIAHADPEEIESVRKRYAIDPKEQIDDVTYTSDNTPVPYRWKVIDASQLQASHNVDLSENTSYPQDLQPRDRTNSAISWNQIGKIASDVNPKRLGNSPTADTGAPIIGPDGFVESGNGRSIALAKLYTDKNLTAQAGKYKKYITGYAGLLGLDTSGVKNPVLVRERVGDLSMPERVALAQKMNNATTLQRNNAEDAAYDAERVSDSSALETLDGAKGVGAPENTGFVQEFFKGLPPEQLSTVFNDKTKQLSPLGQDRLLNALLASAFSDAPNGKSLIEKIVASNGSGIGANLARSIRESSPALAKLRYLSTQPGAVGDYNIANDLATAAQRLASFDSRKQALAWIEQQKAGDLFGGNKASLSDRNELAVLDTLAQDEYAKSAVRTSDLLRRYASLATDALTKPALDGSKPATKIELLRKADILTRGDKSEIAAMQSGFDFAEPEAPKAPAKTPTKTAESPAAESATLSTPTPVAPPVAQPEAVAPKVISAPETPKPAVVKEKTDTPNTSNLISETPSTKPDALTKPVVQDRLALEAPVTTPETITAAAKLGDKQLSKSAKSYESGAELIKAMKEQKASKLNKIKQNVQKTLDQEDC